MSMKVTKTEIAPLVEQPVILQSTSDKGLSPIIDPLISSNLDLPIAVQKNKRTTSQYPIYKCLDFAHFSSPFQSFALFLSIIVISKNYQEAFYHPGRKATMEEEMNALYNHDTWNLTTLPEKKEIIGCRWVFVVKYHPEGIIERLKARLVAKGYTQTQC